MVLSEEYTESQQAFAGKTARQSLIATSDRLPTSLRQWFDILARVYAQHCLNRLI